MSSDLMIVCEEYKNDYDALPYEERRTDSNYVSAYNIDECSMGCPWTDFGKWFGARYCKAPGIAEQMLGIKTHNWTLFTEVDYNAVVDATKTMEHSLEDVDEFLDYVKRLVGKHISTENW